METFKIIIRCISWCLLIFLVLFVIFFLFFFGLLFKSYAPPMHQPQEEIVRIELLDTHTYSVTPLYTLEDSEFQDFLEQLDSIRFRRYIDDPQQHYGLLAIKVTYQNGYYDIIGITINSYCTPEGKNIASDGWYYLPNNDEFLDLFAQYVDSSVLPQKMIR